MERKTSRVTAIEWVTGRGEKVAPLASIEPVELGGVKVTRASLESAGRATELGVAAGDEVIVSREDVIPNVEGVAAKGGARFELPEKCPECRGALVREGDHLVCRNF